MVNRLAHSWAKVVIKIEHGSTNCQETNQPIGKCEYVPELVIEKTVDEGILFPTELQDRKRQLADAIVGGDQSPLRNLSREDLERLLS